MDPPQNPNVGSSSSRRPDMGSSSSPRPEVGSSSSSTRPEVGSSSSSSLSLPRFSLNVRMGTTQSITPVFGCRIDPTARVPKKDDEVPPSTSSVSNGILYFVKEKPHCEKERSALSTKTEA
ncbi:hypothetical protein RchiOBHm_Chr7g0227201 [Rosa chinensis]|uniref:Uncharacterized protein n=1 Tax=Rosa chinensis TaxID=74649 RepID=A0A2P6PEJ6_ROSCH|nr:hypothetical protein RchiOBHm_Chr7g0227201 [Rosa chinensis]